MTDKNAQNDPEAIAKKRKQDEILCRVLAESVVTQLIRSGCETGQLIGFTSEIMRNVIDRGFAQPDLHVEQPHHRQPQIVEVPFECTSEGDRTVIRGARVSLRPLQPDHRTLLETWSHDKDIQHSLSRSLVADLMGELERPDTHTRQSFIIHDERDRPIGLTTLFNISSEPPCGEMAKLLGNPEARGKGYAKESEVLMLGYAFERLKLNRVFIRTAGFNLQNIKLNEKLGLRFEGILRECRMLDDELVDIVVMSILSREFEAIYRMAPRATDQQ
ncbi:MAG: GNAT family protein [Phycisphaerae bacterium]|jgi:RimJ/RimL family protein N-acetyltransferase|nr:GNAT family protein [Phycisphaerae bacterium]